MKKMIALVLAACLVLALTACSGSKTSANGSGIPGLEDGVFTVGMECAYAPSNWQEDTATDSNWPVENVPGAYDMHMFSAAVEYFK